MPFDQKLWNENACGCRCLIEHAHRNQGRTITAEELYNTYGKAEAWKAQPGSTNTSILVVVALEQRLATDIDTFCDPVRLLKEWARPECHGVLIHTERMPDEKDNETLRPVRHVMLALKISGNGFRVWNPTPDGKSIEQEIPWIFWFQGMMRATVLYRTL